MEDEAYVRRAYFSLSLFIISLHAEVRFRMVGWEGRGSPSLPFFRSECLREESGDPSPMLEAQCREGGGGIDVARYPVITSFYRKYRKEGEEG